MHIRPAQLPDVDLIAPLFSAYRCFYEQAADLPLARQFIHDRLQRQESVILLAQDEQGRALGFCQLYPTFCSVDAAPIHVLYDLFVAPTGRRRGIAKALLRAAEQHAAAHSVQRLDLTTAKTNHSAQQLYESMGWVRDEVFLTYSKRTGATDAVAPALP
ncbi:MAG: GNAT family N-acetyltransferase [Burkholderiaceae bacterium]